MAIRLLEGVRVVEFALLEAGGGTGVADLGADVVKVERPGEGDYIRRVGWPFVHGVSLMHHHLGRGKRSVGIDIQHPEGAATAARIIAASDVVIEGMRPGTLDRRGLSSRTMRERFPALVWCTVSGYGTTGPYANLAAHGVAFDAWGWPAPRLGTNSQGLATGRVLRARARARVRLRRARDPRAAGSGRSRRTGQGCTIDISQAEAAAAVDWLTIEGHRAYQRPESEVTGNPSDGGVRREPGAAGMGDSVRYQVYRSADGHVLLMATERKFWRRFCHAIERTDLLGEDVGNEVADHALGDHRLRAELSAVFATRTAEWIQRLRRPVPIAPVNTSATLPADPHFQARTQWLPADQYRADLLPLPVRLLDEELTRPAPAATPWAAHRRGAR